MTRASERWRVRQTVREFYDAMAAAVKELPAQGDPRDDFEVITDAPPPSLQPFAAPPYTPIEIWRHVARAAGLAPAEADASWSAFQSPFPPLLETVEQEAARTTVAENVRRVLAHDPSLVFLALGPSMLDELGLAADAKLEDIADDWQFWDDVGHAWTDPHDPDARAALDRLARLVRLTPDHLRTAADRNGTSMAAEKRRLVQEAVLLALGAAEEPIRVGRRKVRDDPAHPITLADVFGADLDSILRGVAADVREAYHERVDKVERALGGPFRPAQLADRAVYRNWLTKEIRRRVDELLSQDLGTDAARFGGDRRKELSYADNPGTHAADDNRRKDPDRERQHEVHPNADGTAAGRFVLSEGAALREKEQQESALATRIDWDTILERVYREREGPVLRRYIAFVRAEPLLWHDDRAAAEQLGWSDGNLRSVKHRLNQYVARHLTEQRWKALFPNSL